MTTSSDIRTGTGVRFAAACARRFKDPFPAISHWVGAVLAAVGTVVLVVLADGRPEPLAAGLIYGLSLVALFVASGLAHSAHGPVWMSRLDRLDYAMIFVLIAGSYTPLCLLAVDGPWAWAVLTAEWTLAALGVLSVVFPMRFPKLLRVLLYIVMGWLGVFVAGPVIGALPAASTALIVTGGVVYTVGAFVFFTNKPNLWPGRFMAHDLWHVMVLLAAGCHYAALCALIAQGG